MDEHLVGYLLKALDSDTERQVGDYLRASPEGRTRLELLRQALEPLEADKEEIDPPADLHLRTLRRIAEINFGSPQRVPPAPPMSPAVPISWWRRADVLVAASLLLICLPLALPLLSSAHRAYKRELCENNLHGLFMALMHYSDAHGGKLPQVGEEPPTNFAGVFVPVLHQEGYLDGVNLNCPANSDRAPQPVTLDELKKLYATDRQRYEQMTHQLGGCYAFPLGYRDPQGNLHGFQRGVTNAFLPIAADRPPFERDGDPGLLEANSQNHGGLGQNILYLNGEVKWAGHRRMGAGEEDIYLNQRGQLKPGINDCDPVLAASGVRVEPEH
jgi:hypothetical protein